MSTFREAPSTDPLDYCDLPQVDGPTGLPYPLEPWETRHRYAVRVALDIYRAMRHDGVVHWVALAAMGLPYCTGEAVPAHVVARSMAAVWRTLCTWGRRRDLSFPAPGHVVPPFAHAMGPLPIRTLGW